MAYVISYSVKHIIYVCILNESEYSDLFSALERKKNPIRAFGKVICPEKPLLWLCITKSLNFTQECLLTYNILNHNMAKYQTPET